MFRAAYKGDYSQLGYLLCLKQRIENDPKEWEKKGIIILDTITLLALQVGSKVKRGKILVIGFIISLRHRSCISTLL